MANYKAVANGNWSALATWQDDSGGSYVASTALPGASDVVYFNNFTVQINVDVTVLQIRNNSATGVTAGGSGVISTSRTVNADLFHFATTSLITVSASSPSVVNITGNMPGSAPAGSNSRGVNITGNCTVNYVGNVVSTTSNANTGVRAIIVGAGATLNLTGDCSAGGVNTSLGTVNSSDGIHLENNSTLNMVGNVFGGFANAGNSGIRLVGTNQTISITGNVNGLSGTNILQPNPAILLNGTAVFSITGNLTAGQNAPALYGPTATTAVQVFGNVQNASNGYMATIAPYVYLDAAVTQWEFRKSNLNTNTLYTPGVATGHPATNNVRTGIVYGPTNNLIGTCAVPAANTVSLGVPVDNTVGTAQLDANALAIALTASLTPALDASLSVSLPPALDASLSVSLDAALSVSLPPAIAPALDTLLSSSLDTALSASLPITLTPALDASLSASLPAAIAPLLWDEDVANLTTPNSIGERVKNCATVATTGAQIASFNP